MNKKIKKTFANRKVKIWMRDGTIKVINGKEWLKMDSRLLKHFEILD